MVKGSYLFQTIILGIHVSFRGCRFASPVLKSANFLAFLGSRMLLFKLLPVAICPIFDYVQVGTTSAPNDYGAKS